MLSVSALPDRGMRILSVSSGSVSLASFSFRLSLEDRFHRIPAQTMRWILFYLRQEPVFSKDLFVFKCLPGYN